MIGRCLIKVLARWLGKEMVLAEHALESVMGALREVTA